MKTIFENYKQLKENFMEYHKEHDSIDFRHFLTDVLNYPINEAIEIEKNI